MDAGITARTREEACSVAVRAGERDAVGRAEPHSRGARRTNASKLGDAQHVVAVENGATARGRT